MLAQPGVPVVLSPKSALILQLSVWDNATQTRIAEPEHITLLENLTAKTLIGSGLTQSAEAQIENLAQTAAKRIERWLRDKHEAQGWFAKGQRSQPRMQQILMAQDNSRAGLRTKVPALRNLVFSTLDFSFTTQ